MGTAVNNDDLLGFVEDPSTTDDDFGFVPEQIDPGTWKFPAGMEHLDPARPESTPASQGFTDRDRPANWGNPLQAGKRALQSLTRPAAEAIMGIAGFDPEAPMPGNVTLKGTSHEALAASALSSYGVKPSEQSVAALTTETGGVGMSTPVGPQAGTSANVLMKGADMLGQAPLFAAVPSGSAKALGVTSTLGKAALGAGEGAAMGALQGAASEDSTTLEGALTGGALGGGLSLAGSGLKALLGGAEKARQPVLTSRPQINESVLRAKLEQEAIDQTAVLRGVEIDPSEYPNHPRSWGQIDPKTGKTRLMESVEGEWSYGTAVENAPQLEADVSKAADEAKNALVSSGPPPQAGEAYDAWRQQLASRGTVADSPAALATPRSAKGPTTPAAIAAAANAATPPPPANSPPVQGLPLQIPAPGTISASDPAAFKDIQDAVNKVRLAQPGVADRVKNFLLSPGVRGAPGVRHIANEAKVARSLTKMSEDTMNAVEKSMGPAKHNWEFRRALSELADGRLTAADLETKFPQEWKRVRDVIEPTVAEIQQNSQILKAMGLVQDTPSWMQDKELSQYAARLYLSKINKPGQWARVAPQDVIDRGIEFIAAKHPGAAKDPAVRQEIANEVLDLLNSGKSWEELVGGQSPPEWSKPFKHLKSRQQLPKEIRELLGEIEDGPYRIAHTIGTQRALIAQLQVAREVAINPSYAAKGPVMGPSGRWVEMPKLASLGPLGGMFVRPDVAAALGNAAHVAPRVSFITNKLMRFFKANVTVFGGVPAWSHEFIGNLDSAMLSGGLDITRPLASGKAFMRADKILRAYFKNPSSPEAREMLEVFRLGAADMGWSRAELRDANRAMLLAMERELKAQRGDSIWHVADALKGIMAAGSKIYARSGQAWDMVSLHMRTASYLNLRDKFILQGMAPEQARRVAAQRVVMSFPSPHNLSAGVENLRNSALGFMAPFTTYLAEDARIRLQIPQRIAEGEVDLPIRMAVHYGVLGAAVAGASAYGMHKYGVTKEELDAANAEVTRGQSFYRPMQWAIPLRDSQGRLGVVDLTWVNPAFRLPQGDIVDPLWKRLTTNTLLYPFEGGAAEKPLRELAQAAGLAQQAPQFQLRPGEAGLLVFLNQLNRSGFGGPSMASRVATLAKQAGQTGHTSPYQEVLDPGQVAASVAGFPIRPVTVPKPGQPAPQMAARAVEFERNIKDLTMSLRSAVASGDQERAARVRAMIDATIADFRNVGQKVKAAQQSKVEADFREEMK